MLKRIILFITLFTSVISVPKENQFNAVEVIVFVTPYIESNYRIINRNNSYRVNSDKWFISVTTLDYDIPLRNIIYHPRVSQNTAFAKFNFGSDIFQSRRGELVVYIKCKDKPKLIKLLYLVKSSPKIFYKYIGSAYYYGDCFNYISVKITYKNTETGAEEFEYFNSKNFV
ncbi:hypothetical protein Murmansk-010 [Murmansk poxvirus]|uniref:Uncharacterized protein n=1 Tax=Murmansk poxvirus TaxID=2025359 RepID=A0A223FME9_9POXV|nr:hypothetical protein CKM52_gp010 [Murmansk poxvirus]AST09205.1 hypothetical protein Murmansk-010 [Murmansk poxvirus]